MPPSPFDAITEQDEQDALHQMTVMMTGTKALQDEPGLVFSLAQAKAQPQDAQAIDEFLQSLNAEKRVALARSTGDQIVLSDTEQAMLQHNGVPFQDVLFTQADATTNAIKQTMAATQGKYTLKQNIDGSLATDKNGNLIPVAVHKASHHDSGWFSSFGSFVGHLGSAIGGGLKDVGEGILTGIQKTYNFASSAFNTTSSDSAPGLSPIAAEAAGAHVGTNDQDMLDAGYNPNSFFSALAFQASGKAHTDLSKLNDAYGSDKVDQALQYLADPKAYREKIEKDPNSYAQDADGHTVLTKDAASQLEYLNSPEFESLARRINAHQNTVGNDVANTLGIDPLHHSTLYNITAAGTNLAAAFVMDPTMVAFKAGQAVKLSQVAINGLTDNIGAASILTSKGLFARNVQRGWQRAIDLGAQFRAAAGDTAKQAAITAQFRAELPGLEPIMENFTGGEHVFAGFHETETVVENGKVLPRPIFEHSDGIQNLGEAADFIKNKYGLVRLMNGRAATQSRLMPGALSSFGYRKLKGMTAGWMTARSAVRAKTAATEVISRAEADPALATKLLDEGVLRRMAARPNDAINFHDGTVLAEPEPVEGLASQQRAQFELTPKGEGVVKNNLRATGDVLGEGSRFSPTAIAERFRQAGIRLSTLLPRNTVINIHDARSGDIVYKTAMTFLNRGEANTLRAAWNTASAGERKAMIHGLIDQLGHAAGLGQTETGRALLARAKTGEEAYSAAGNEVMLNGDEPLALFEDQTRSQWILPSFQELQKASDKIGLYDTTMGRAATSNMADLLMSQWKMGALFKPSTVTRNMLEGWLRTALDGRAGDAIKARAVATSRNKDLWKQGYGLDDLELFQAQRGKAEGLRALLAKGGLSQAQRADAYDQIREAERLMGTVSAKPAVQHLLAKEAGNTKLAKAIENGTMLTGDTLGRSTVTNFLANVAPLSVAGRAYRYLVGKTMDEETVNALLTLGPDELAEAMDGYGRQILESDLGFRNAARQSSEIADAGWGPARLRYAVSRSRERGKARAEQAKPQPGDPGVKWTHESINGTTGADRYADNLARRVNAMPETARTAIEHLRDRDATPITELVKALEKESKNTSFGKVYFPEGPTSSVARKAATDDEVEAGKLDWASKIAEEYRYLLTGRNGKFQDELADYILENGKAPDGDWIAGHLVNDNRPETALAPEAMAMVPGGVQKVAEALQDIEGGAYQWLVERPLQRTTSSPVFLANYAIARKQANRMVEQMIEQGMSREAAENLAKEMSIKNAWVKTEQLIDDPGQKAQFDVIARNMFPFARATQAMIRRWGTGLWQNPAAARKLMLSYEAAEHSGFIYNNSYGEASFTYPASGVANTALQALAKVPGWENIAAFPVSADMTGQVLMSVPGADNPLRISMGPMVSIPFREVYKTLLPYLHTHAGLDTAGLQEYLFNADQFINGPIGAGETWVQLVPNAARKFYAALSTDDRNSALASAQKAAIQNLMAAGLAPAPNASPAERQQFLNRVQTQTKSQLFLRFALGLFAPAAPSNPTEATPGSGSDYAWSASGVKSLSDEYKAILNETGGDVGRANAVFTALHPDEVVYDPSGDLKSKFLAASAYETSQSGAVAPGSYLPSTESTLKWLDRNADFVNKYGNVAAYFLPEQAANEPFSDAAYKAQIEFGLRMRKTPAEFLQDIYVKHAESVFYPADKALSNQIAQAKAEGDTAREQQLTQIRHDWTAEFKSLNPFFADKIDDYGQARKTANDQLGNLREMVAQGEVPDGLGPKLALLLKSYDNYVEFTNSHQGQTAVAIAARSNALKVFNAWADQELSGTPLATVFNGVFRTLNTNFDSIGS